MMDVQDRRSEAIAAARAAAFTVVIPCYNEEQAIADTIRSIRAALSRLEEYAIIVVDDGSTDGSAAVLAGIERGDGNLRIVRHPRNRGYGAALKTGIEIAETEYLVITDADGTYPNERIPDLVEIARQADMVVGARVGADVVYPLIRKIPKAFLRIYASWLSCRKIPDLNSGLRVLRRSVVQRFLRVLPDTFSFTTTITIALHTNGYEVRYIPISYAPRIGKSKIRPIRDTLNFLNLIVRTGTYFAPMRVFFPVSVLLFLGAVGSALFDVFVIRNLTDKTVLLALFSMNAGMFALLADMIDKRTTCSELVGESFYAHTAAGRRRRPRGMRSSAVRSHCPRVLPKGSRACVPRCPPATADAHAGERTLDRNAAVLEAGCGAGFSVTYLRGRCSTYVGIDYSENFPSVGDRRTRRCLRVERLPKTQMRATRSGTVAARRTLRGRFSARPHTLPPRAGHPLQAAQNSRQRPFRRPDCGSAVNRTALLLRAPSVNRCRTHIALNAPTSAVAISRRRRGSRRHSSSPCIFLAKS